MIAGYLCNRTSVGRALEWCKSHIEELRKYIPLNSGIASEATISRMFAGVDTEMLGFIFSNWIAEILDEKGIHVIIDGKALKGGTEKVKGGKTPYVLNAIDAATKIVLTQLPVDSKSNEITAIPKLLEILGAENKTFTIDAIGTLG